jgi:small conductance mechanosensitive channel
MDAFGDISLTKVIIAIVIVVVFFGLAWLARFLIVKFIKKLTEVTPTKLDENILTAIKKPVIAIVAILGLYIAVLILPQEASVWSYTLKGLATALSLLGIFTGVAVLDTVVRWYRRKMIARNYVGFTTRFMGFIWIIMILVAIWLAVISGLSIWGQEISRATSWLGEYGWRIALIIGIAILAIISMGEVVPRIVVRTLSRRPEETEEEVKKRSDTLSRVLVGTTQVFIVLVAVFMILSELEIDIAPILAGAGVVGVAIGFGAQGLVRDLVAGFFIIIENQYRVGDVVNIADVGGIVESINLRRTVLRDLDGIVHIVPNGEIRVANNYTKEWSRVNLDISVAYGEDLDHVMEVINKVGKELAEDPKWKDSIIAAPQAVRVNNFGDSGIDIKIVGETLPMQRWEVMGQLRLRLKREFDKEGIEIPWPHTKVYFGNAPPAPETKKTKKGK